MPSPYDGLSSVEKKAKTKKLIKSHPLKTEIIRQIAEKSWDVLWETTIGKDKTALKLSEIGAPATVIGYFFEKLFAKELALRFPGKWRGNENKDEKDFVYIPKKEFSVEMKTSGQSGTKIYGNRSYGKKSKTEDMTDKPEKSGYYITVNFYGQALTLVRFGWIDVEDWQAQKSETGQSASLKTEVYQDQLIEINGDYQLNARIETLSGVGKKTAEKLKEAQINSVKDLLTYQGKDKKIRKFKKTAQEIKDQIK